MEEWQKCAFLFWLLSWAECYAWDFANEELLLGRAGEFDFTGLVKRELSDFLCVFALCIFTCSFRQCEKPGETGKVMRGALFLVTGF